MIAPVSTRESGTGHGRPEQYPGCVDLTDLTSARGRGSVRARHPHVVDLGFDQAVKAAIGRLEPDVNRLAGERVKQE
jgi:hypothetical protein